MNRQMKNTDEKWMNRRMKTWMNKWMNRRMKKLMNKWMNRRMKKGMKQKMKNWMRNMIFSFGLENDFRFWAVNISFYLLRRGLRG